MIEELKTRAIARSESMSDVRMREMFEKLDQERVKSLSRKYGLNPDLVVAYSREESGLYKSGVVEAAWLGFQSAMENHGAIFCANCGRAISDNDPLITGSGVDHEEACCSIFCHDEHEERGCPQGVPGGNFRDSEWYAQNSGLRAELDQLRALLAQSQEVK